MQSIVVRMCDHEVDMESNAERRKRLNKVRVQQHRGSKAAMTRGWLT